MRQMTKLRLREGNATCLRSHSELRAEMKMQASGLLSQDSFPSTPANHRPFPPPLSLHHPSHTLGPALPRISEGGCGRSIFKLPFEGRAKEGAGEGGAPPNTQGREPKPVRLRWGQCRGSFSASTYGTIDGRSAHQTRDKS